METFIRILLIIAVAITDFIFLKKKDTNIFKKVIAILINVGLITGCGLIDNSWGVGWGLMRSITRIPVIPICVISIIIGLIQIGNNSDKSKVEIHEKTMPYIIAIIIILMVIFVEGYLISEGFQIVKF